MADLVRNATDALADIRHAQSIFEKHEDALGEDGENIGGLLWSAMVYLSAALEGDVLAIHAAEALRSNPYLKPSDVKPN